MCLQESFSLEKLNLKEQMKERLTHRGREDLEEKKLELPLQRVLCARILEGPSQTHEERANDLLEDETSEFV